MKLNIVKQRAIWYSISTILVVASLASVFAFGLRLSLDFTGGVENAYSFDESRPTPTSMKEFASNAEETFNAEQGTNLDIGTPVAVESGTDKIKLRYRVPQDLDQTTQESYNAFNDYLSREIFAELGGTEEASFTISPSVGDVLKSQALTATLLAIVGIVLYIIFAFRKLPKNYNPIVFGLNTIVALLHDVIVMFGIFVLLGYTMNVDIGPFFITAVLTILGYSVNDTIVLMDRVRENMIINKGRQSVEEAAETAIWQTMARSLNTSVTVLITLGALLVLGAESIQMFVLALFVGVVVGTYSSIFIAAPMLVTMKRWLVRK